MGTYEGKRVSLVVKIHLQEILVSGRKEDAVAPGTYQGGDLAHAERNEYYCE